MDLNELRLQINAVDDQIIDLFRRRMDLAAQVADYKRANDLPIFQPVREREILDKVAEKAGPDLGSYARVLFSMLMKLSKHHQIRRHHGAGPSEEYARLQAELEDLCAEFKHLDSEVAK